MEATDALALWLDEGHIDSALAGRLRESLELHETPRRANKLIWILASIGAVLIGGGLLLFIAGQWDQSSPTRRIMLLLVIWLLSVAGAVLADRQSLTTTARGLWLLSSIAVGTNIFLIGQVFNLPLNYWQGTLLWLIAALAIGWASPSSAQGWLAVPLAVLTLGWFSTPSAQFFDQGAFLWDARGIRPLLPIIGIALVALALLVRESDFAWLQRPASAFGALLIAAPIVISTFHPEAFAWVFQIDVQFIHFIIALVAVVLVGIVWSREPNSPLVIAFGVVTALLVALLPQVSDRRFFIGEGSSVSWLASAFDQSEVLFFLYTAVVFAVAVATIMAGEHFAVRALVNVGFMMVAVLLAALYVGRIAGELPTSIAVTLGGLLMIGGAIFLERKRRDMTAEVSTDVTLADVPGADVTP